MPSLNSELSILHPRAKLFGTNSVRTHGRTIVIALIVLSDPTRIRARKLAQILAPITAEPVSGSGFGLSDKGVLLGK